MKPWTELLGLIAPHAPRAKTGHPPFALETMLRIHFVQHWFYLSDLAMEEALFETALYREFVGLSSVKRIPDRVGIYAINNAPTSTSLVDWKGGSLVAVRAAFANRRMTSALTAEAFFDDCFSFRIRAFGGGPAFLSN